MIKNFDLRIDKISSAREAEIRRGHMSVVDALLSYVPRGFWHWCWEFTANLVGGGTGSGGNLGPPLKCVRDDENYVHVTFVKFLIYNS